MKREFIYTKRETSISFVFLKNMSTDTMPRILKAIDIHKLIDNDVRFSIQFNPTDIYGDTLKGDYYELYCTSSDLSLFWSIYDKLDKS